MGWIGVKIDAVVWVPEERDPFYGEEDDFEIVNRKLAEALVLLDDMPGETQMTDSPEHKPPNCPDCKKPVDSWKDLKAYNAGDEHRPDFYLSCTKCYAAMGGE